MKTPSKFSLIFFGLPIFVLLYFSTNIYGYFRFKSYCSSDGGLRVYESLQKNVGWQADNYWDARVAAQLKGVGFVRYKDEKSGNYYDLYYKGHHPGRETSYEKVPADNLKALVYRWHHINENLPGEIRLGRSGHEVFELQTNRILVRYYKFGYSQFDRSNTLFDSNSSLSCFYEPARTEDKVDSSITALNTAFKN